LYQDNIGTISDADNSKLYGLTQFGLTNFNPATATVWLHNDRNTNNTATGLSEGFHIVRARAFLPRTGKSGVFNTFSQAFYYDAQPPAGVIAFPSADNQTINSSSYTVVVRADGSVTGVDFNIQDSDPSNDDASTSQNNGNGLTNGVPVFVSAAQVNPDPTLSQQYTNYPLEFRFNYAAVPSSGTATFTVRLRKLTSGLVPNRVTTLTRTVNTAGPANVLEISSPETDGSLLVVYATNSYLLQACFTPALDTNNPALFSIYINGVLQPRTNYVIRPVGAVPGCPGLRSLLYNWSGAAQGTNIIQVFYTNLFALSDTRTAIIAHPGDPTDSDGDGMPDWMEYIAGTNPFDSNSVLRITSLLPANAEVLWESVSNINYRVWATTNLNYPLLPISALIRASGTTTIWPDPSPDPTNKFYRIQVVP
jgi:hypothetical protein